MILAYMCVKLQMRLYVCHRVGPFWVQFGSILGPFGSNWGPFWVHFGSIVSVVMHLRISVKTRINVQTRIFSRQEFSLDKNQLRLFKKNASEASKSKRAKRTPLRQQTHSVTHI